MVAGYGNQVESCLAGESDQICPSPDYHPYGAHTDSLAWRSEQLVNKRINAIQNNLEYTAGFRENPMKDEYKSKL